MGKQPRPSECPACGASRSELQATGHRRPDRHACPVLRKEQARAALKLEAHEAVLLAAALRRAGGDVAQTARELNMSEESLWRRLTELWGGGGRAAG